MGTPDLWRLIRRESMEKEETLLYTSLQKAVKYPLLTVHIHPVEGAFSAASASSIYTYSIKTIQ